MNYIDRFDRVEDYNLGDQYDLNGTYAPEILGSTRDALLLSFNRSKGYQFSAGSFVRGEAGVASRFEGGEFVNSLARFEIKYYHVLGSLKERDTFLGKHTFAASYFLDYGDQLDGDRQFTVGGDNALRGYKARAFTGDRRMVLNIEDRVHLADDVFHLMSVGAAAFIDAGGATNDGLDHLFTDRLYGDAGIGLRLGFPRSTGGGVIRFDVAVPFRDGPDGTKGLEVRLVVGGGQLFSSQLRSETLGPEKANVAVGFDR
jgi:outer membrane protein assembly factor BamA